MGEEIIRQEPGLGSVVKIQLSIAIARLTDVSDLHAISTKQTLREDNHKSSALSKWHSHITQHYKPLQVGDLVYLNRDRD